jgi:hypothetical protein
MTMYVIMLAKSWDCIQPVGHNVEFKWSDDSIPFRWLPVYDTYERAREAYPNEKIVEVETNDQCSDN